MDYTDNGYFQSDYFNQESTGSDSAGGFGSFTRGLFDNLSSLAAPLAGVFTAVTNQRTAAQNQKAAQRLAAANAAASQSWQRWIPFGIGAVVIGFALVLVVSIFRKK